MPISYAEYTELPKKTCVVVDGDNDMSAYAYIHGWNESEHIVFAFYNMHDLGPLTGRAYKWRVRVKFSALIEANKQNG